MLNNIKKCYDKILEEILNGTLYSAKNHRYYLPRSEFKNYNNNNVLIDMRKQRMHIHEKILNVIGYVPINKNVCEMIVEYLNDQF